MREHRIIIGIIIGVTLTASFAGVAVSAITDAQSKGQVKASCSDQLRRLQLIRSDYLTC
jgi:Na+/H+-translocating membrane pyrophosphatase